MGEVTADSALILVGLGRGPRAACMLVAKANSVVDVVDDRLDARPTGFGAAE